VPSVVPSEWLGPTSALRVPWVASALRVPWVASALRVPWVASGLRVPWVASGLLRAHSECRQSALQVPQKGLGGPASWGSVQLASAATSLLMHRLKR
jgi:hypothetical protein